MIDLKDAFWACPLDEKSRDYFAFEWEDPDTHRKQQLRWTVLPQGFTESPNLFGQALEQILQEYNKIPGTTMIQYVDDLLIAGKDEDAVRQASISLLNFWGSRGLKVSKSKLQFVEEKVKYLGHLLNKGTKGLDPERVKGILGIKAPATKRQVQQLLGLTGYCRQWIEDYIGKVLIHQELITQVLQAIREPKEIAVVHIKGHQKGLTPQVRGNNLADQEAKRASLMSIRIIRTREDCPDCGKYLILNI